MCGLDWSNKRNHLLQVFLFSSLLLRRDNWFFSLTVIIRCEWSQLLFALCYWRGALCNYFALEHSNKLFSIIISEGWLCSGGKFVNKQPIIAGCSITVLYYSTSVTLYFAHQTVLTFKLIERGESVSSLFKDGS